MPHVTAYQKEIMEQQFQRELRLTVVSRAGDRDANGSTKAAQEKRRTRHVMAQARQKSPKKRLAAKEKQPPKAVFDAQGTLRILVDVSRDVAAGRAEKLAEQAAAEERPPTSALESTTIPSVLPRSAGARIVSRRARTRRE